MMEDLGELQNGIVNISLTGQSFLYSNLESQDFVTLETRTDLGQVIVATKDIAVGTTIFREKPILVYEAEDMREMVSKFTTLDSKSRDAVLNMHRPLNLSSGSIFNSVMIARELSLDPALVQKLIGIDACHSHDYHGSEQEIYFHAQTALFLFCSKRTHSCNPNTVLEISRSDGRMECKVLRPIQSGDVITYALIGQLLRFPTHIKRKEFFKDRGILCRCPQCLGPDYARPVHCKNCKGGVLLCSNPENDLPIWSCTACDAPKREERRIKSLEEEAVKVLVGLDFLNATNPAACSISKVKNKMKAIAAELHPQHFLVLDFMDKIMELCVMQAVDIEIMPFIGVPSPIVALAQGDMGTPIQLRREAAEMGVALVQKLECIAAGRVWGYATGGCTEYAPVPYACKYALQTAKIMMRCPIPTWPTNGRYVVHRYIPLMKVLLGAEHEDVIDIERQIPPPENRPTLPFPAEKKAKQRRKKRGRKKGRKR